MSLLLFATIDFSLVTIFGCAIGCGLFVLGETNVERSIGFTMLLVGVLAAGHLCLANALYKGDLSEAICPSEISE